MSREFSTLIISTENVCTYCVCNGIFCLQLLGGPPNPDLDSDDNVISVFINKVINPDKPFESSVSY